MHKKKTPSLSKINKIPLYAFTRNIHKTSKKQKN